VHVHHAFGRLFVCVESHLSDVGCLCGSHEAVELRDDDKAVYMGKGVLKAVANVNDKIAPAIMGMDPTQQAKIDKTMMEVDKTENKVCTKNY
jgi:enolase